MMATKKTPTRRRAAAPATTPPPISLDLRQTLDAYPGRLLALAAESGVPYTNLRRFRDGELTKTPWDLLRQLAACKGWASVPGANLTGDALLARLVELFTVAQAARA